jgi:colicin import membrane protein
MVFESKSVDRAFDQFVSKTIEAANPMPSIAPALNKTLYELGVRFKPGIIQ